MPDDDQSLGGEQTFSGKVERDDSPQSLGDEGTYAGGPRLIMQLPRVKDFY